MSCCVCGTDLSDIKILRRFDWPLSVCSYDCLFTLVAHSCPINVHEFWVYEETEQGIVDGPCSIDLGTSFRSKGELVVAESMTHVLKDIGIDLWYEQFKFVYALNRSYLPDFVTSTGWCIEIKGDHIWPGDLAKMERLHNVRFPVILVAGSSVLRTFNKG